MPLLKDLNLFCWHISDQETSSIFKIGFALSKWPHFNIAYVLGQRLLHTWTSSLGTFFPTFVKMKISKDDSNIICRSSKNITFPKIWRVWLKNWACHAHFNFKLLWGMAGSVFDLHPWNFGKLCIFYRSLNDISTIFWNSWWGLR